MQRKNITNFDQIKVRLLQFIESQNIPKTKFFELSTVSPSNFSGKGAESALSTDKIVQILTTFSDLSPDWLLLGKGEMLREKCENVEREGIGFVKIPTDVWETMQLQTASLKAKDEQISRLIEMLSGNRGGGQPVEATVEG